MFCSKRVKVSCDICIDNLEDRKEGFGEEGEEERFEEEDWEEKMVNIKATITCFC